MNIHTNTSNGSRNATTDSSEPSQWGMFGLLLIILASAGGNLLVCLAIGMEKRLQNMTNYFLLSLALADLLVSLLVMPLGMIVEIYGFFPADPYLCTIWVSMDVLLCTASIWHMCTMSMDRFFTLKYPMRYGRNKTRKMVIIKIMIVWCISFGICSPVFIMGFVDTTHIYIDGLCMPQMENFIIYGSVFAFFVPLCIMILTYVLTVRILWKNQQLVKDMKQNGMSQLMNSSQMKRRSVFSRSYCSQDESTTKTSSLKISEKPDKYLQVKNANGVGHKYRKPMNSPAHEPMLSPMHDQGSRRLSQEPVLSTMDDKIYKRLTRLDHASVVETDEEETVEQQAILVDRQKKHYLNIPPPSPANGITSDSFLSDTDEDKLAVKTDTVGSPEDEQALQRNNALLNKRLYQIQKEMDLCLHTTDDDAKRRMSKHKKSLSDSVDSDVESSSNEILTVKLKPEVFYMYKLNVDEYKNSRKPQPREERSSFKRKSLKRHRSRTLLQSPSDVSGTESGPETTKFKRKRSIREFMRNRVSLRLPRPANHLSRTLTKLLPNKAATNERKASKVLGIIFIVFVVLWTPFFITNVISGICSSCMTYLTPQLMSVFLWMGYAASLANPIIYTMFNTSFRRAFVRILLCRYSLRTKHPIRRQSESHIMTFAASWHSDRRNTVSMTIDR